MEELPPERKQAKKSVSLVGRGILATEESSTSPSIPAVVWVMEERRSKTFVFSSFLLRALF
jgi:hypothetical protein